MLGYWKHDKNEANTKDWLKTEDLVKIENDFLFIQGRLNETIHLSTGIAILPSPLEQQLKQNSLFENVMLFGENKEFLSLFCQLNINEWEIFLRKHAKSDECKSSTITMRLKSILLIRVKSILHAVPSNSHIQSIFPTLDPWSIDNGLINAQGKVNRSAVTAYFSKEIKSLN